MNLQPNRSEYQNAIYQFGYYAVHRIFRPWLLVSFIYKLTSIYRKMENAIEILHHFSTTIIEQREACFRKTISTDRKLTLIDILLQGRENNLIDVEGIREEVDTFMFEVMVFNILV